MLVPVGISYEVEKIAYKTYQPGPQQPPMDVLYIWLEGGEEVRVPNGDFCLDNPALCTLAYLGVRPSNLTEAVGETLPVVMTPEGVWGVPDCIVQSGRRKLEDAVWGPDQ